MLHSFSSLNEFNSSLAFFLMETMPLAMLVIDDACNVRILNATAAKLLQTTQEDAHLKKYGDVFRCANTQYPGGCGCSPRCSKCILRRNILQVLNHGSVSRDKGRFDLMFNGKIRRQTLLITSAPLQVESNRMVIILAEDVSLVTQMEGLIPICSSCHRICNDRGEWVNLEKYLLTHSEAELTHDFCPICYAKMRSDHMDIK